MDTISASTLNINSVGGNQINNYFGSNLDPGQGRRNVIQWLSNLNFKLSQSEFLQTHEKGTGNWLLESPTFQDWRDGVSQTLWCPGNPGAGKTILASIVVNHLQKLFKGNNIGITCIYCNYKEQTLQTATNLIASLLKQLVQDSPTISDNVQSLYNHHQNQSTFPTLDEFTTALETEIETYAKVFIVVDALDECPESNGCRVKLLRAFQSLSGPVNLMVTSRNLPSIEQRFQGALRLHIRATDEDVTKYIQSQLVDYPDLAELQDTIITKVVRIVGGMFLLARLHMNMLVQQHSAAGIITALDSLPNDMDGIYDQAMERIDRQPKPDKELAKQVLSWITYARRPLSVKELQHALAVSPGMTKMNPTALVFKSKLTSVCAGLVVINEEQKTFRLAHHTTQQYIENQRESRFPNAETEMAATCLRYLSFDIFARGYCDDDDVFNSLLEDNPFLHYAANNWGHHARQHQEGVGDLAMDFLRDDLKVACASQVMFALPQLWENSGQEFPRNFGRVHISAFFGLERIVHHQLENGADMNKIDGNGLTPIWYATSHGYEGVVKLLVACDNINPNPGDKYGRTPLSCAATTGYEAMVKLLLGCHDIKPDLKDITARTPLSYAAEYGHDRVVKLLLTRDDVEVNSENDMGRAPLSCAAEYGHDGVVKLLLACDVIAVNSKDNFGQTPLSRAAWYGNESVVKLLIRRDDIERDSKDNAGRTPLSLAAESGHQSVVNLLLTCDDVDRNSEDKNGRTPLMYASMKGCDAVIKLLLACDKIEAASTNEHGRTALSYAAEYGNEDGVKLLVARHDTEVNVKDKYGQTPLAYAAIEGHEAVVKLLLACDNITADLINKDGRTPLSYAAECGHESVTKLLIACNDVDVNSKDKYGRVPLSYPAEYGHERVVKALFLRGDVDVNSRNVYGQTPLSYAAMKGHDALVKLLLAHDDIRSDLIAENGRAPLSYAAEYGHESIVKLLSTCGDLGPNLKDEYGRVPLSYAAEYGHSGVVEVLLLHVDIDVNSRNAYGRTPLSYAGL